MTKKLLKPSRTKVAVLCGGQSSEREISLLSGKNVAENLDSRRYAVTIVEITKSGQWLDRGRGVDDKQSQPLNIIDSKALILGSDLRKFDVIFIALHGSNGEDGRIQALLDTIEVPYTGSGVLASALAMDKVMTSGLVANLGIGVPREIVINNRKLIKASHLGLKAISELGYPCVVKPNKSGSSIAISIINNAKELSGAVRKAFKEDESVVIQEYLSGRELTCSVMGNTGQYNLEALPVMEIITPNKFFDYNAKYHSSITQEIVPAALPRGQTKRIQETAKAIHNALGCRGLTRSDFILSKNNRIYFLEINTVPGLTRMSLSPKSALAAGMSLTMFFEKLIAIALMESST